MSKKIDDCEYINENVKYMVIVPYNMQIAPHKYFIGINEIQDIIFVGEVNVPKKQENIMDFYDPNNLQKKKLYRIIFTNGTLWQALFEDEEIEYYKEYINKEK